MAKDLTRWANQKQGELLNFYGVVKDNSNLDVEYAIVMLFACYTGGIEKPIEYTFTNKDGEYSITVPKLPDNKDFLGFKVRASKPHIQSKVFDYLYDEVDDVEPIELRKVGESEYYYRPLYQPAALDEPVRKDNNIFKRNEFISTAFFLLILILFVVNVKSNLSGR